MLSVDHEILHQDKQISKDLLVKAMVVNFSMVLGVKTAVLV